MVIAGFLDGTINAFKIETGEKTWSHQFDNKPYSSQLKNNIISIAADKSCYGFNLLNEEIIWEFKTEKLITSPPKITSNTVYFGSWDGNIYALDLKTGEQKWKFETGWGIDSTPTVDDGMVFVGSLDNRFYALDEDSGVLVWCFQCKSAVHSSPVVYGDLVFFGSDDGIFYALDKEGGELTWSYAPLYFLNDTSVNNYIVTPIITNPVLNDGIVYFGAKGSIFSLDSQTSEPAIKEKNKENNNYELYLLIALFLAIIIALFVFYRTKKK
jgi:outer membrane protein assembly factor BamB